MNNCERVKVVDTLQDLVDQGAGVLFRVAALGDNPVKQLSPRHPVDKGLKKASLDGH